MSPRTINLLIAILAAAFLINASAFVVDKRQSAIVFQLGSISRVINEPGLHWKVPFLQNVRLFDKRILTIDSEDPSPFNTRDKQNVIVDSYVKWRIVDVETFYRNVGSDPQLSVAISRLQQSVNNALYAEIGKRTQNEIITGRKTGEAAAAAAAGSKKNEETPSQREVIMSVVQQRVNEEVKRMGVEIVDVRLKRVDYSQKVSDSVYQRMQAERKRVANELRSEGAALNIAIKADADKKSATILAEAYNQAQDVKGRGDAEAAAIYAKAYSANPEFYKFYRSLEAYKESFKSKNDVMVLQPDSEFFKYFRQPAAK